MLAVIAASLIWLLPKVLVYFMPFVIAIIIALIASPLVKFLESKIKIKRKAGSAFVIILTLALVVFVLYLLVSILVTQVSGFAGSIPKIWGSISGTVRSANENWSFYLNRLPAGFGAWLDTTADGISESLSEWVASLGEKTADFASNLVKNLPLTIVGIIMCILASYLFVAERDYLNSLADKLINPYIRKRWDVVKQTLKSAVGGYFKAQFKIMCFVYVILFIGLLVLQVKYAFLIAFLIAFLDFLPFFGTGAVMWPWALIAAMQKNYRFAIGMMIVWAVSQLVRQLIQPKFVGDSVGMKPIPTLILLYLGFRLGGALGLIIAVPIGMIIVNLYRAGLFSNVVYSTKILAKDIARLRKFTPEELKCEGIEMNQPDIDEDGNIDEGLDTNEDRDTDEGLDTDEGGNIDEDLNRGSLK